MPTSRIYLSVPHMGENEKRYVMEAFESNWVSTVGPNLDAFENAFSKRVGQSSVALSSGTAGMHLALRLLGVGPGDEVFCPTLTFVATANPIAYLGARPVFLDSDRGSWNLDPALLAEALERRAKQGRLPKAVVVVHLYGQSAHLHPIMEACHRWEIPILEDAAEALGTLYQGKQVGAFTEVGVFSFNGNKIITTSGGGMLTSPREAWVQKARFWSQQAREPSIAYEHVEAGYNYRMSNVLAGIGRGQLEVLDAHIALRRAVAFRYRDAFADLEGLTLMPQAPYGFHTNWLSCFLVDESRLGLGRDALLEALARQDIEARPVWKPMHTQPLFAQAERIRGEVAEDLFHRGICLPSSSSMSDAEQARVIEVIRDAIHRRKRS